MENQPRDGCRIGAVVLAAGLSSRMGAFKPLLVLGERPILLHAIENLRRVGEIRPLVVVTGHRAESVNELLAGRPGIEVVHNERYADGGMLSSVQAGVAAMAGRCDAFLVALGDHPLVRPETVSQLLGAAWARYAAVVKPVYRGKGGHPVLIDASQVDEILALPPAATLKTFMERAAGRTEQITVDDPGVVMDVDTPEDFRAAQELYSARAVATTDGQGQIAIGV